MEVPKPKNSYQRMKNIPNASLLVAMFNRKEPPKRSHTLRYVLKNRATDTVLFVVLFTLYLKEDVDENGIVKDGVEGGKPLALMGEKERRRHERAKNGLDGEEEESGDSGDDEKKGEEKVEEKNGYVGGEDDDVD